MNRRVLRTELGRVARNDLARARRLLDKARTSFDEPWLDYATRARLEELAGMARESVDFAPFAPLAPGEVWLLLVDGAGKGDVARGVVQPLGSARRRLAQKWVEQSIAGLAASLTVEQRTLPAEWIGAGLDVPGDPDVQLDGASLGLAVCVGVCAAAAGVSADSHVAATAAVDADGTLKPVHQLNAKCWALREQWPQVTRVVVATEQGPVPDLDGLTIVRAKSLRDALPHFGVEVHKLPRPTAGELKARLGQIEQEEERHQSSSRWFSLATEAWEIGRRLASLNDSRVSEARVLAALLASHAGENETAVRRLREISDADCNPSILARKYVFLGSCSIDGAPKEAIAHAQRGLAEAQALTYADHKVGLLGRAHGTLGRAYMAAGRWAEAERHLRLGLEHHEDHAPGEAARSACYVSCCLRMAGRAEDALGFADDALSLAGEHADGSDSARTSVAYARLERGRALEALGRLDEAVADLSRVVEANVDEESYPALGGRRSLVSTLREAGRVDEAREMLLICERVARGTASLTLRKVGAVAAAEELRTARRAGEGTLLPSSDLEAAWRECFADASANDVLRTWVY